MLSLYIHTPFCVKKCVYCGFYSTSYTAHRADEYLMALKREAESLSRKPRDREVSTVYIGGGTPTALSLEQLDRLLSLISRVFRIKPGSEWTSEANPNCVSIDKLTLLRNRGVTRLSLGVQSLSDPVLSFLGRSHTAAKAEEAFHMARSAGFDNIGVDLIYGVPDLTNGQWRDTLSEVVSLGPEHISTYSLSLDEGSKLKIEADAGRVMLPDDETVASQYETARSLLLSAGYEQYEISNFCRPGRACLHNIHYWQREEYLGLGPAAWSFIEGRRYRNAPDVSEYCARIRADLPVHRDEETFTADQAANETVMLALRMSAGLDLEAFSQEFGDPRTGQLLSRAEPLRRSGLIDVEQGRMRLTPSAFSVAHAVLVRLFS